VAVSDLLIEAFTIDPRKIEKMFFTKSADLSLTFPCYQLQGQE